MATSLRSLSYVILFASLSAVTALGIIGFLNNAYAINANTSDNMKVSANMNASGNMTKNMNTSENMTTNTNTAGNTPVTTTPKVLSPLQQFKSGTPAKSVQCVQGFTLVIKTEDGSPACVTSQIVPALTARGWGTTP